MAEVSRACSNKEAECRQLQDCSQEQQQKLAEAAAAAQQQAAELTTVQVWTLRCCSCCFLCCQPSTVKLKQLGGIPKARCVVPCNV